MARHKIVILEDDPPWSRLLVELATTAGRKFSGSRPEVVAFSTLTQALAETAVADLLIVDMRLEEEGLPLQAARTRGLLMLGEYEQTPAMVVSARTSPRQAWDLRVQHPNVLHFFEKATFDEQEFIDAIREHLEENPPQPRPQDPARIFVSYSSIDVDWAERIIERLTELGVPRLWIDQREIKPGADIIDELQRALDSCTILLLLLSKNSTASDWVTKEWHVAFTGGKRVIPIKLDDCELPTFLRSVQSVNLSGDEEKELQVLAETLREEVAG